MKYLLIAIVVLACPVRTSSGQARSIQMFVETKDNWKNLVGTSWRLEGRFALFGGKTLRFRNCDMSFQLSRDVTRPTGDIKNLEVTGTIEKDSLGRFYFDVKSIRKLPSDHERFLRERAGVLDNVNGMYDLADWATQRATFYDDEVLRDLAQELKKKALLSEFRKLDTINRKQLDQLLAKAKSVGLDDRLVAELLHRGYWNQFTQLKKTARDPADFSELLVNISKSLPGATTPLSSFSYDQAQSYYEDAFETFESASPEKRVILGRLFHIKVAVTAIELTADPSGANGYRVSRRLRDEAPERTDLIDEYEKKELEYSLSRLDSMTRAEMLDLSGKYKDRGDEEKATEVRRQWLAFREKLARDGGFLKLADYADEWVQLLDDKETAAKYYVESWTLNTQYPLANNWLEENGYAIHEGKWVRKEFVPATMESQLEAAIREGRPEKGMSPAQVKAAMGVEPDAIVRVATKGQVSELWTYRTAGIMIRFSWKRGEDKSSVKSINSMASRK